MRALRKGWIKADRGAPPEEPPAYLLWQNDGLVAEKTANGALHHQAVPCDRPHFQPSLGLPNLCGTISS